MQGVYFIVSKGYTNYLAFPPHQSYPLCMSKILKRDIIAKIKKTVPKVKASFSFDAELFERFQAECAKLGVAQSRTIEELMKAFLGDDE